VQLKLSISRLRMVQQKDTAKAKQQRREMAQLLEVRHGYLYHLRGSGSSVSILTATSQVGKVQSARIRVENIIRSDITTELHEILELYCELLLARSQLLDPPSSPYSTPSSGTTVPLDPALEEAVRSIIYAASRTEIKELHAVRALLLEKFGKDIAVASMEGDGVADRVLKKLRVETPKPELVDAYLAEIARFYGVPFGEVTPEPDEDNDDNDEPAGGLAEEEDAELDDPQEAEPTKSKSAKKKEDAEELVKATPPKKLGPQSPLRVVPPSPSTDNVAPKLKLPGAATAKLNKAEAKKPGGKIPDVDELAKRFAQLKR
jgi:vacuolar protein sorting-associated protein IST1